MAGRMDLFRRFLRIGFAAWGGPIPQIALLHREFVEREGWMGEARFRKVLALYQAIPGPEAHELAVHLGMVRQGRIGGALAGLGFMLPGVVLVTVLAALYVAYGSTAEVAGWLLYGARPAVLALVAVSFGRLARASLTKPGHLLLAVGSGVAALLWPAVPFPLLLLAAGVASYAAARGRGFLAAAPVLLALPAVPSIVLAPLALLMLKVGLLTFGGAYTAIPILREGAVAEHGWITDAQFLDALALSSIVPGPPIAVGTFVGYQAAGLAGAVLATILIFLPAFGFTLVGFGWIERAVEDARLHGALLGVTAAVIGLIVPVAVPLARAAVPDLWTLAIALGAVPLVASRLVPVPVAIGAAAALGLAAQAVGT